LRLSGTLKGLCEKGQTLKTEYNKTY